MGRKENILLTISFDALFDSHWVFIDDGIGDYILCIV
jgi:hypothetical protein